MSLEKAYRDLTEAAASRKQDQTAEVPVHGSVEATAEQKAKGGSAHANRKADKSGTMSEVGVKPTEVSSGVGSEDLESPNKMSEPGSELPAGEVGHGGETDITKTKLESEEIEDEVVSEAESCDDEEEKEEDDEEEMKEGSCSKKMAESAVFKLSDELGSLLESEGLDEEFKSKAISIFEAAVNVATEQHLAKLDEQAAVIVAEEVEAHKAVLDEQVEKYLDYVVQEWVAENQVALQSQVRNQVAESFMTGLKDLLEAHYVDLPQGKEDMYEAEVARSQELETELAEQVESVIELRKQLAESQKTLQLEKFVAGLTEVEAEKIRSLAESLEFDGEDSFQAKLGMLKENYFPEQTAGNADLIIEDAEGDAPSITEETKVVGGEMSQYLSALSKMKKGK